MYTLKIGVDFLLCNIEMDRFKAVNNNGGEAVENDVWNKDGIREGGS